MLRVCHIDSQECLCVCVHHSCGLSGLHCELRHTGCDGTYIHNILVERDAPFMAQTKCQSGQKDVHLCKEVLFVQFNKCQQHQRNHNDIVG